MDPKQSDALDRVMDLVRFLRTHCPWDAAQTPRSLIPYLLEEAHEAADAIAEEDDDALRAELGDLLLNLAFQVVLARERNAFDADAVADTVIEKMRRRHPHLYGLGEAEEWETMKARERAPDASILHGVARGLDPLSKAHRIQDRVSAVGFDWADYNGALEKVEEELEEVREELLQLHNEELQNKELQNSRTAERQRQELQNGRTAELFRGEVEGEREGEGEGKGEGAGGALEEELGDLLFAVVNLTRLAGANAFTALQSANGKFARRFRALEALARDRGLMLDQIGLEALDVLWDEVKATESTRSREAGEDAKPDQGPEDI